MNMNRQTQCTTTAKAIFLLTFTLALSGCGGSSGTPPGAQNPVTSAPSVPVTWPSLAFIAGDAYQEGAQDGPSLQARFTQAVHTAANINAAGVPYSSIYKGLAAIVSDNNGNLYVRDQGIRQITATGEVTTIVASTLTPGSLKNPIEYLAIDPSGALYFTYANAIHKRTPDGQVTSVLAGTKSQQVTSSYSTDVVYPNTSPFYELGPIAVDRANNLYVSDGPYIRKVTPAGASTLLATLPRDYGATIAMAVDRNGNVYLAQDESPDYSQSYRTPRGHIRNFLVKIDAAGAVSVLAGRNQGPDGRDWFGYEDGVEAAAKFSAITGVAVDDDGTVYVAEFFNNVIRKVAADGTVSTVAGKYGDDTFHPEIPPHYPAVLFPATLGNPVGLTLIGPKTIAFTSRSAVAKVTLP